MVSYPEDVFVLVSITGAVKDAAGKLKLNAA